VPTYGFLSTQLDYTDSSNEESGVACAYILAQIHRRIHNLPDCRPASPTDVQCGFVAPRVHSFTMVQAGLHMYATQRCRIMKGSRGSQGLHCKYSFRVKTNQHPKGKSLKEGTNEPLELCNWRHILIWAPTELVILLLSFGKARMLVRLTSHWFFYARVLSGISSLRQFVLLRKAI
jgi:hypothetical protein